MPPASKLQAAQFVGVVRLGEQTIQILPKTHRSAERVESAREATANLLHLLAYAADVPIENRASRRCSPKSPTGLNS